MAEQVVWFTPKKTTPKPPNQSLLNTAYKQLVNIDAEEIARRFKATKLIFLVTLVVYALLWTFGRNLATIVQAAILLPCVAGCSFGFGSAYCGI